MAGPRFAEPIDHQGMMIVPVQDGTAGAFVLREGKVMWRPAVNVNRVIMGGQIVAVVALLVARAISRNIMRTRLQKRR